MQGMGYQTGEHYMKQYYKRHEQWKWKQDILVVWDQSAPVSCLFFNKRQETGGDGSILPRMPCFHCYQSWPDQKQHDKLALEVTLWELLLYSFYI